MLGSNFGSSVYQRRKQLDLSLRDLARRSGISASAISRVENGKYSPTLDNAVKLATALGLELPTANQRSDGGPLGSESHQAHASTSNDQALHAPHKIVDQKRIATTPLKPGFRRNLSKIAARNTYQTAILLKGAVRLYTNDGFMEKLKPGAVIDCRVIAGHTFWVLALDEAELLWIG